MWDVVHANLVGGIALGGDYQYQGPLARMFPGPSNFTVPVYRLYSASLTDHVFLVSDDGAAPSLPGYTVDGVIAYVYPTQICGSTPLYAVYSASLGDHWYTISTVDRARMLQLGWVDAGVQGYVLPLGMTVNLLLVADIVTDVFIQIAVVVLDFFIDFLFYVALVLLSVSNAFRYTSS
jgi:hypothetical protein